MKILIGKMLYLLEIGYFIRDCLERNGNDYFAQITLVSDKDNYESDDALVVLSLEIEKS